MSEKVKETILTISLGVLVLFTIAVKPWTLTEKDWLLYVAMGVSFIGITWGWLSKIIHKGWFLLADKLGFIMSRVILSVVFIVLVVPFGLVSRLFRRDVMLMKQGRSTYFRERRHTYVKEDFENPW